MTEKVQQNYNVESENQNERIEGRRQRIQIRNIQKNQPNVTVENSYTSVTRDISTNNADDVITSANKEISSFKQDGQNLLSDVKVTALSVEANRRREQEKQQQEMRERLETEDRQEEEKFKEIVKGWDLTHGNFKTPQNLHNLLTEQTEACKQIINQKNKIINRFKEAARAADDSYTKDLKKENADLELIAKRMEQHVNEMTEKYQTCITRIEDALKSDRSETLAKSNKITRSAWEARAKQELEHVYKHLENTDIHMELLDEIRRQGAEAYAIMKDKLERDVHTHEQQLQQMKAIYQLNQEKLVYNHEILRNREEESQNIKNQQKRRITKLQDSLNSQRQKLVKQEQQFKQEVEQLSFDYQRIVQQHKELETKMKHFTNSDSKRFNDIWKMNFNTVKQLAAECLVADEIIHRQQLGIPCHRDSKRIWFVEESELHQISDATNSASSLNQQGDPVLAPWQEESIKTSVTDMIQELTVSEKDMDGSESLAEKIAKSSNLEHTYVKQFMNLLANEGDFLFEDKLITLLASLQSDHSTLVKLEAIFSAVGIQTEEDVRLLAQEFKAANHELDLNSANQILPVLKTFIMHNSSFSESGSSKDSKISQKSKAKRFTMNGKEWAALDKKYWSEMSEVIPKNKLNLWDALEPALAKYYDELTERRKLIDQTDNLKRQNSELRLLLQQYLSSQVNKELQIPPTKVLQSETK